MCWTQAGPQPGSMELAELLVRAAGSLGQPQGTAGPWGARTSEKPPLPLGSTNRGFRASSFLAKSWACGRGRGWAPVRPGLPRTALHLLKRHMLGPYQTPGHLGLPFHSQEAQRKTHPPELQAFLHDGVGREEDQEPVGDHAGDVACKYQGCGQRDGGLQRSLHAPGRAGLWRGETGCQHQRIGWGLRTGQPGAKGSQALTHLVPSPGRTSMRRRTCRQEAAATRAQCSACPPPCPSGPLPFVKGRAELGSVWAFGYDAHPDLVLVDDVWVL